MLNKFHLLFVCTSNISRSPLAASLFENSVDYEARSAGINPLASISGVKTNIINQDLIDWADKIFVMDEDNEHQASFLSKNFNVEGKNLEILNISDKYNISQAKDYEELKKLLEERLARYLE